MLDVRKKDQSPALLFAVVITLMVIIMLVWHARLRVQDFTVQHQLHGEHSVKAAASAIKMFTDDMHRSISLFADERRSELEQLAAHPDDKQAHEVFGNRIKKHFPEYLMFSYTDAFGEKLIGGPKIPEASKCRSTIQTFANFDGKNELELHQGMDMLNKHFHFDVMSLHTTREQENVVFFLSFKTSELSKILSRSEVTGHKLFLIRQENKPLIDITSEGDLTQLTRSPVLEPEEIERINFSMPVAGTRWDLVELSDVNLIADTHRLIWTQTAGIFIGFFAVIIVMFLMIVREERRRSVAEDALFAEHKLLELRVEERTEKLVLANSALMESEQRYLELFEHTSDLVQSAGSDGELLFVNQAWLNTLGYDDEDVADLNIVDVVHPESLELCQKMFQEMLSKKDIDDAEITLVDDAEITLIAKDGQNIVVEGSTSCKFYNGNPVATRGIYRDITEQKKSQAQVSKHRRELAQMTRLSTMGELASALAHELNQPLASISNYAKGSLTRLKNNPEDLEPVVLVLEKIADEAGRTGDFIRHWADFLSRGEIERLPENINQTISNAVSLVEPELQQAGVTVKLDLADNMPQVSICAIAIDQVILNLVRNSVEAISDLESDSGQIIISTTWSDGQSVCVSVEDNGPGITDALIGKIFDPFCTTKESGMGLGLAICRSIIVAHAGKMSAENLSQGGTKINFTISLDD